MQKLKLFLFVFLLATSINAKEIIKNPPFIARNNDNIKVTQVELNDTATILSIRMKNYPKLNARIDKDNCIRPSDGGTPLHYKSNINYQVDMAKGEFWIMPDSGAVHFSIVYPKLDPSVERIDFSESEEHKEGYWEIYGIQLRPHTWKSKLPESLQGCWRKADGSNIWTIGLFENLAFYDNKPWQYNTIREEGLKTFVGLKNGSETKELTIRLINKKSIGISEANKKETLCVSKPTSVQLFDKNNDKPFSTLFHRNDSATYGGYIKGYAANMPHEASVVYKNMVSGTPEYYPVKINADGTFKSRIPVYYPSNMIFSFLGKNIDVFLEPGKSVYQMIDLANDDYSYFMGSGAWLNVEIAHSGIKEYEYSDALGAMFPNVLLQQFADTVKNIYEQDKICLANYQKQNPLSQKATRILKNRIEMKQAITLLDYNLYAKNNYGYRQFTSGSDMNASPFKNQTFTESIYNTIGKAFKDSFAISSNQSMETLTKLLRNMPAGSLNDQQKVMALFQNALAYIKNKNKLTANELIVDSLLNEQIKGNKLPGDTIFNGINIKKSISEFLTKYQTDLSESLKTQTLNNTSEKILKIVGKDNIVATLLKVNFYLMPFANYEFLNEQSKQEVYKNIPNQVLAGYVIDKNNELQKQNLLKRQSNIYRLNATPDADNEKLLDAIIEKYKGKVIYIDFWATWCGPCGNAMKRIAPLKEELKNDNVVFLYLTGESSPKKVWENTIPDIRGEHYRLSNSQWEYICKHFEINTIPHYMVVDKSGKIIDPKSPIEKSNDELKEMLLKLTAQ
ncbi:MAG: TlpA disulfide reductase family protein [Bacteroidota bacterium]|nr:TlpA disulfide reductase family protein [Bacteroidota bacterium]